MTTQLQTVSEMTARKAVPDIKAGDTVRVHQKIKEGTKERIQVFEGVVLAAKHGKGINATITVRKVSQNIGVERVFPLHSPLIQKIEVVKRSKVRRAKLYYLRTAKGKKARLRAKAYNLETVTMEEAEQPQSEETPAENESSEETPEETPKEEEQKKKEEAQPAEEGKKTS